MTNRIESILRTMTEWTHVSKGHVDGENFSRALGDLDILQNLSYKLYEEIRDRKTQVYNLMYDEIKEP